MLAEKFVCPINADPFNTPSTDIFLILLYDYSFSFGKRRSNGRCNRTFNVMLLLWQKENMTKKSKSSKPSAITLREILDDLMTKPQLPEDTCLKASCPNPLRPAMWLQVHPQ